MISWLNQTRVEVNFSIVSLNVRIVVFNAMCIYRNKLPTIDYTMFIPSNHVESTIDIDIRYGFYAINAAIDISCFQHKLRCLLYVVLTPDVHIPTIYKVP